MSQTSNHDLRLLHDLHSAHEELHLRLLELGRLSEQQAQVPADRPDALLAILERKQQVLREIAALNAPALFLDTARLVTPTAADDSPAAQARCRVRDQADANVRLWQEVVESERRACAQWSGCLERLRALLAAAQRSEAAKRAYGAAASGRPSDPRFVDRRR